MPWRSTREPYKIWLSEIILQQTRVAQGLPYWQRFVESYPTIHHLASAPESAVLRVWQGLGYYSRARNLHATAKHISKNLDGVFPSTYSELLKLKGVGPYTAAAIASICFKQPVPVVDGNVFRFASRYFGIEEDIAKASTRKVFENYLSNYISKGNPDLFNQAMMEYGATICAPKALCSKCSFLPSCKAYETEKVNSLPIKSKKLKVRDRFLNYLVFHDGDDVLMKKRSDHDVWAGLYDFYLIEGETDEETVLFKISEQAKKFELETVSDRYKHILSHQRITAVFYQIAVNRETLTDLSGKLNLTMVKKEDMVTLPKSKLILNYLDNSPLT